MPSSMSCLYLGRYAFAEPAGVPLSLRKTYGFWSKSCVFADTGGWAHQLLKTHSQRLPINSSRSTNEVETVLADPATTPAATGSTI